MKRATVFQVLLVSFFFGGAGAAVAQPAPALAIAADGNQTAAQTGGVGNDSPAITLDAVVTDKAGAPVAGLDAADFKLLDNKQPQSLLSVEAANGMQAKADAPVEAILVVDGINSNFVTSANERGWLANFLKENGSELALPTSLVVLADKGMTAQSRPSRDGKTLLEFLDNNVSGLRSIRRSEGREGALEREQLSLNALSYLATELSKRPGRKLLIWVGPGWFLMSNPGWDGGKKYEDILFNYIVLLSTQLRAARMTVYSIDPAGAGRGQFYYQTFLKGVEGPRHTDYGDLLLQVLATQTGGKVLFGNNDLAGLIDQSIEDAKAYYVLTFKASPGSHPDEYHSIEVQVDKPGLKARTRTGYYADPSNAGDPAFPKAPIQSIQGVNEP
jgi:VWFA-related protein